MIHATGKFRSVVSTKFSGPVENINLVFRPLPAVSATHVSMTSSNNSVRSGFPRVHQPTVIPSQDCAHMVLRKAPSVPVTSVGSRSNAILLKLDCMCWSALISHCASRASVSGDPWRCW